MACSMLFCFGMKALPKILLALTGVAALSLAYPASVQAVPTTYQYTGHHFTDVSGPYTTSMFVSGMVTLAGPLGANMPLTEVTPIAFTFFDGVQTLSSTTPGLPNQDFSFATNARGEITSWFILVADVDRSHEIATSAGHNLFTGDAGFTAPDTAFNSFMPGVWRPGSATPDTGSTLSLMTLTLIALGVAARRFQRAAG